MNCKTASIASYFVRWKTGKDNCLLRSAPVQISRDFLRGRLMGSDRRDTALQVMRISLPEDMRPAWRIPDRALLCVIFRTTFY